MEKKKFEWKNQNTLLNFFLLQNIVFKALGL